jgi:sulfate transport system ATP-binding protein
MNAISRACADDKPAVVTTSGVRLTGITAEFAGTPAARDIDLSVPAGEFLALVGPSGAGKTTLLRIIAGLEPRHEGNVSIAGRDVTNIEARHRNIGFVFQSYALFGHMSVAENVAFGLRVRPRRQRPARATIARRVNELLELVQIAPLAARRPAQLSGGQRQRVALARALATDPGVLLLDEPFGALDPLVRKDIRAWLRGLHDRLGLTSILVTHDQSEAIEIADRIAVLRDGRIEQVGTPDELEDHPATDFVHRFMGERVTFPGPTTDTALSIRPWRIRLTDVHGPASDPLVGQIVHQHRAGPHIRYGVRLADRVIETLAAATNAPHPVGSWVSLDITEAKSFGSH